MRTIHRIVLLGALAAAGVVAGSAPASAVNIPHAPCTDTFGNQYGEGWEGMVDGQWKRCGQNGVWIRLD